MQPSDLRVALFSGNYNYVKDGANQALNRLVGHLLGAGAQVRVYSPTSPTPAFPPVGDLVSVPSIPFPGRGEYRVAIGIPPAVRADLDAFRPNVVHLSAPDPLNHSAKRYGRDRGVVVGASVHTRFDTYFEYYRLGFIRPGIEGVLRRFYRGCDAVFAPSTSMARLLVEQDMADAPVIWGRGVDHALFNPGRRDMAWRRSLGIGDEEVVLGFVGRLVLEKGLGTVAAVSSRLIADGVAHRLLVVGDGPARATLAAQAPHAVFAGFLTGPDLARAYASMDLLLNPSITETFGNVTSEAMACALPVVGAREDLGASSLIEDGASGSLVPHGDTPAYVAAAGALIRDPAWRAAAGARGAAIAAGFDWDRVNDVVLRRYLELASPLP